MARWITSRSFFLVPAFGLLLAAGVPAHADGRGPVCFPVYAHIVTQITDGACDSPVGLCTVGEVTSPFRLLRGPTHFMATGLGGQPVGEASIVTPPAEPTTTWSYSGALTLTTTAGELQISDVGVLDTVDGTFSEIERPVSGTGAFANVSGHIFVSGYVTPDGNGFDGRMTGQLCWPAR